MLVHSLYFWLHAYLPARQLDTFPEALASLMARGTVQVAHTGKPAPTDRPIIDSTYSQALILVFSGQADHDSYQDHDVHELGLGKGPRCGDGKRNQGHGGVTNHVRLLPVDLYSWICTFRSDPARRRQEKWERSHIQWPA